MDLDQKRWAENKGVWAMAVRVRSEAQNPAALKNRNQHRWEAYENFRTLSRDSYPIGV